jgi:integration host factor subunit beta
MVLPITRAELVARLASSADVSEREAGAVVGTVLDTISRTLAQGGRIELRGFGVFSVRQRDAREARNPRTGETVQVTAKKTVHFKPGRQLHHVLNGDPEALAVLRDQREEQCRRRDERRGQLRLL